MKVSINYVCLVGVLIGLMSIFGPWSWTGLHMPQGRPTDFCSTILLSTWRMTDVWAPQLFLIGTVLALLTPFAGMIQLAAWLEGIWLWGGGAERIYEPTVFMTLAFISMFVTIYSIRRPYWMVYGRGTIPRESVATFILRRTLTFCPVSDSTAWLNRIGFRPHLD